MDGDRRGGGAALLSSIRPPLFQSPVPLQGGGGGGGRAEAGGQSLLVCSSAGPALVYPRFKGMHKIGSQGREERPISAVGQNFPSQRGVECERRLAVLFGGGGHKNLTKALNRPCTHACRRPDPGHVDAGASHRFDGASLTRKGSLPAPPPPHSPLSGRNDSSSYSPISHFPCRALLISWVHNTCREGARSGQPRNKELQVPPLLLHSSHGLGEGGLQPWEGTTPSPQWINSAERPFACQQAGWKMGFPGTGMEGQA